jgi:hypothetical protein
VKYSGSLNQEVDPMSTTEPDRPSPQDEPDEGGVQSDELAPELAPELEPPELAPELAPDLDRPEE